MTEYHTIYKDVEGTTTEWDDLQVKYGNKAPKEKPQKEAWLPAEDVDKKGAEWVQERSEEDLEDLEDDFQDDRFMDEYRRRRLAELQAAVRPRFGSVELIKGPDFVREVSQASTELWVVVHLFKDSVPESALLAACLTELAEKYPDTKFVKIISTDCIKDYPDHNLPTLLVYNNAQVKATLVGLHHFGGRRCTAEDVAFALCKVGPVLSVPGEDGEDARDAVARKVQKDYVEKLMSRHVKRGNDSDSD